MTGPLDALDDLDARRKAKKAKPGKRPRDALDLDGAWSGEDRGSSDEDRG